MQKISITLIFLTFVLFKYTTANAQDQQTPSKPCTSPEANQLDFWLGEWELTWPAEQMGGNAGETGRGTNTITKPLGDCVIQEAFRFPAGQFNGHSVSVYAPKQKVWKQTWVDNQGGYLLFTGEFKDGKMILGTEPFERQGKTYISRMVFKNIKANSLDWDWQRSEDGGQTWTNLWNIHYERNSADMTAN